MIRFTLAIEISCNLMARSFTKNESCKYSIYLGVGRLKIYALSAHMSGHLAMPQYLQNSLWYEQLPISIKI